ncbi:uncharacterized protein LY89DRAFT_743015 [Mollisia scopiformis]|uniref:Uncharacterized protein n=1 Tax=Mollisia scopiformis TaxID=149040 RepID=A0A132B4Q9_MOLSC|nr:uncharacterized protein LY89DRAFT_743015 [Mollisia scopiformis]KUJ07392.1 hypothetical protein LY89DRAFT_743015 [Mollisia scopiformis]
MSSEEVAGESNRRKQYSWRETSTGMERLLSYPERMYSILNRELHGQHCGFIGATIQIQSNASGAAARFLATSQLHARAIEAFKQTRWRFPSLAATVADDKRAIYKHDSIDGINHWAERTVSLVIREGGWLGLRQHLSRTSPLPNGAGDFHLAYIVVSPDEAVQSAVSNFDVVLHTSHVFVDGTGVKCIFNEFLDRLASPMGKGEIIWGQEIFRLLPPSVVLMKEEAEEQTSKPVSNTPFFPTLSTLTGFTKPDIGLPIYRPELGPPKSEHRGTQLVSHTFEAAFLPRLLDASRQHGLKLASVMHAALLTAVHQSTDVEPGPEDVFRSGSVLDLRNGWMSQPYSNRRVFVNIATSSLPIVVPCALFKDPSSFWEVARFIAKVWAGVSSMKGIARTMEAGAKAVVEASENKSAVLNAGPTYPKTCPYFVSDPPGSQILSKTFSIAGTEDLSLVLESYQMATDQIQSFCSGRAHSWDDKLTLCLVFNAVRNPAEKIQAVLGKWVETLQTVCEQHERGLRKSSSRL